MAYEVSVRERDLDYEYCNVLNVTHDGNVIHEHYDHGEPEDNTFYRDWSWVAGALEEAYQLGHIDGVQESQSLYDEGYDAGVNAGLDEARVAKEDAYVEGYDEGAADYEFGEE